MMNVKMPAKSSFGDCTPLALITVSVPSAAALGAPVKPVIFLITALPCAACRTARISRPALPLNAARYATKVSLLSMRGPSFYNGAASIAWQKKMFDMLRVRCASRRVFLSPLSIALPRTERANHPVHAVPASGNGQAAFGARSPFGRDPPYVTTCGRTVFLPRVRSRRLEMATTHWARFRKMLAPRFVRAGDRAKSHCSVWSLGGWLLTAFTQNHATCFSRGLTVKQTEHA